MRTERQTQLIQAFLANLDLEQGEVYQDLVLHLSLLGYDPKKQRANIVFTCPWHGKQIAKIGFDKEEKPFFGLRFSACQEYSSRFEKIVQDWVTGPRYRAAPCTQNACGFCRGEPSQHTYSHTMPDGEVRRHCGTVPLVIPGLCRADVPEVKRLIEEVHRFLMEYEAEAEK